MATKKTSLLEPPRTERHGGGPSQWERAWVCCWGPALSAIMTGRIRLQHQLQWALRVLP